MEQRIVIEIDALLDTRLGTIAGLYPEIAKEIVTDPVLFNKYQTRRSDEFSRIHPGINDAAYAAAYDLRNVDTLKRSTITEIVPFLSMLIQEIERAEITGDAEVSGAELILNTWPYELSENEVEAFKVAIMTRAGLHTPISSICVPVGDTTTSKIAEEKWVAMILYSLDTWFKETFKRYPKDKPPTCVPAASIITPGLLLTEKGIDDPIKRQMPNGDSLDPFIAVKWNFASLIGLVFTPPSAFSILDFRTGCLSDPDRLKSIVSGMAGTKTA